MGLADIFKGIVDSLPDDWTDLELDLRIADESRYVEGALYLATCNARPYSHHDWHWRRRWSCRDRTGTRSRTTGTQPPAGRSPAAQRGQLCRRGLEILGWGYLVSLA